MNDFGIIFVVYSLYLAIVMSIEISMDKIIRVLDIRSNEDISVMLFIVVNCGINIMFIISRTIIGIKMCQYILNLKSSGMDRSVRIVSSIY